LLPLVIFTVLLGIPIRFFWLNSYFLKGNWSEAVAAYKAKPQHQLQLDAVLLMLFVFGMGALGVYLN